MAEERNFEEATPYVLAELSQSAKHRFERRMEVSAELREDVRQLEEGALALALAAPRRQPPPEVWAGIEKRLARERGREAARSLFGVRWWRSGWAAATACLLGWLVTLWHVYRAEDVQGPEGPAVSGVQERQAPSAAEPTSGQSGERRVSSAVPSSSMTEALHERVKEVIALRRQVADLSNRMTHLSEVFRRQEALLSTPGRLTFFQLTPEGMPAAVLAPISTNLQRALWLAMARELGWVGPGVLGPGQPDQEDAGAPSGVEANSGTNQAPVELVDLRSGSNTMVQWVGPAAEPVPAEPAPDYQASFTPASVPGFVSGTNAVLAFDSSVVAVGSTVSFWTAGSTGEFQSLGQATVGNNPVVVTVPFSSGTAYGGSLTVVAEGAGGVSNVFQFSAPGGFGP